MEGQIDSDGRLAGLAPCHIQPVDGVHRFGRCVERLAADLFPGSVVEREDRQHAIAEKLQYLTTARAQRSGQCLEDLVEQFDDYWSRGSVSGRCEATHVGVPQHSAYALDRTALDRPGMNAPAGVIAEIGSKEARGDRIAG